MSRRQSFKYISEQLELRGIRPKNKFGQNFLIDLNLLELLFASAQVGKDDVVLEVGTGTASLSCLIADAAAHLVTVEIDRDLIQIAETELADFSNVSFIQRDALRNKNHLSDEVLEPLRRELGVTAKRRLKLVANLPYNVATPIISNLLFFEPQPVLMVVTIQKELAERIVASPRTKDYSALSIWIQSQCHADIVRVMPPSVFWPRPKVDSAILRIQPDPDLRKRIAEPVYFHETIRNLFCHRRKFLRTALSSIQGDEFSKPNIDRVLEHYDFPKSIRAEEIDVSVLIDMVNRFCESRTATP